MVFVLEHMLPHICFKRDQTIQVDLSVLFILLCFFVVAWAEAIICIRIMFLGNVGRLSVLLMSMGHGILFSVVVKIRILCR